MVSPDLVHQTLSRHQLVDGFPIVLDLEESHGTWLRDARTGEDYLDAFTCFASWPVGYNHPMLLEEEFGRELLRAARTKASNSDLYTGEMADFVEAFATRVTPAGFPHHFWVAGGSLAVENALKTAFDWKARKLGRTDLGADVNDLVILHFREAFHGRSGYTMSLTNTLADKVGLYPKFDWPRVHNPAIEFDLAGGVANDVVAEEQRACQQIDLAYQEHGDKIAAIIIEPMQGEGGDNHFRAGFLARLREYADVHESLLIFDEIQTGFFGSGKPWLWQHYNVRPDIVAFGKKTQVCGIYASPRVDEVEDNVFRAPSRINSTWGGNLADMVRARRFIEIIEAEDLAAHITLMGQRALAGLRSIAKDRGGFTNVRGIGSLLAFTLPSPEARERMLAALFDQRVLALRAGPDSIRFRLPLVIRPEEVDILLDRVEAAQPAAVEA